MRRAIQVLIVVLILLSCGGLFSVFIVQVREAANRTQCTNNLRIFGLALGNYHDSSGNNKFPTAAMPNPQLPPEKRLSWIVAIYPFVEASNIYSRMEKEKAWDAEENQFATELPIKFFDCPGYLQITTKHALTSTCYIGISGIGTEAINLPVEDARAGFFGYERILKRADLNDRADSILMLVETSQVHGAWTAAGSPTARGLIPTGAPYIGAEGQLGGNHRHGANAGFADGSVRFIEQSIDPAVWEAMATLSGKGNRE